MVLPGQRDGIGASVNQWLMRPASFASGHHSGRRTADGADAAITDLVVGCRCDPLAVVCAGTYLISRHAVLRQRFLAG